jgi:hypothetical protein
MYVLSSAFRGLVRSRLNCSHPDGHDCTFLTDRIMLICQLQGPLSPTTNITSPKKDNHVLPISPLERMLQEDRSPVRGDGSDKFFGMENVSPLEFLILQHKTDNV